MNPDGIEVLATYLDWAERKERTLGQLVCILKKVCDSNGFGGKMMLRVGQGAA